LSRHLRFAFDHPYLLAALVVVLFLPWLWMSFLLPLWAIATALALVPIAALVALVLAARDLAPEEEEAAPPALALAAGPGDVLSAKWRKRTRLFQQVVIGLDTMLGRWDAAAQDNRAKLRSATESLDEVVRLTESAVSDISRSFRVVVSKAREQTEAATTLLGRDEAGRGILSLPEFIAAYDRSLTDVTSHMMGFSEAADEMALHQKRVTEHARVMEQTIDDLRDMASQISRIALDGSVAMTSQTVNPRDFIAMTDRIRTISAQAHELTRKTRQGLEAIGNEVRQGNRRTMQVADEARAAVGVARAELGTLNAATIEQTRQIEGTLQRINALSADIQDGIDHIVIAMQFQDITRQMLERLRRPVLDAASESLELLSHETRALLQRDLYRAVRAYAESAVRPTIEGREGREAAARGLDEAGEASPATAAAGRGGDVPDGKVEIF
jgi:methyl-accepting chemotaxis protein